MKTVTLTEENFKNINALCHHALKGVGIEAYQIVKSVESWIGSAVDKVDEGTKEKT